jgi:vacuolar protein sorting-associated protein IST1
VQNLIKTEADCPYDMREAVCTLIWAASRTEIPELAEVKKQLTRKYGQDFEAAAIRNVDGCVNERVMQKLSVQPPSAFLVVNYMKEIAKEFKVDWEPEEAEVVDPLAPIPAPTGATVMSAAVSGPDFAALYASVRLLLSLDSARGFLTCAVYRRRGMSAGSSTRERPVVPAKRAFWHA